MSKSIHVDFKEEDLDTDKGRSIPGVVATCTECDHVVESYGTSGRSVRRCLALMREECPMGENNYYVTDESWDDET